MKSVLIYSLMALMLTSAGCAANKKSARDQRRDEMRVNADLKRIELNKVAGIYEGVLATENEIERSATLTLEVKDDPQAEGEQVDAVLIPVLSGSLAFDYGSAASGPVRVTYAISTAEYDPAAGHLDLLLENSDFKALRLELKKKDKTFAGSWVSPETDKSGSIKLTPRDKKSDVVPATALPGKYFGRLYDKDAQTYRFADLIITASPRKPDSFAVNATLHMYVGQSRNQEYVTYQYHDVLMSPLDGEISLVSEEIGISIVGMLLNGAFMGGWESSLTGDAGPAEFSTNPAITE